MSASNHPYANLPAERFWRKAITDQPPYAVDPVVKPRFTLSRTDRVATAGSCFAQHISRALKARGFDFLVTEPPPEGLDAVDVEARGYGVFTARFGNVYTTRQLLQLFDRAFGQFDPVEDVWVRSDARLVDPFRPAIEPAGFATEADLRTSRAAHLEAVRRMFLELDVFVFTLGLTEGWRSRKDGAVFPVAPGVSGGRFDPALHEFVNFELEEITEDLGAVVRKLRERNPRSRVLLTVSPVPLVATYEGRHVLVSTTYSKSVLRVAADKIARSFDAVDYYPSYEIITGNFNGGRYFEPDLRSVNELGVEHALRPFLTHYAGVPSSSGGDLSPAAAAAHREELSRTIAVVCDEEAIDRVSG
jgi:hypothetical protein